MPTEGLTLAAEQAPSPAPPPVPDAAGYTSVRGLTEEIAAPLSAEDQTVQSMPDVSPTKWHRAHTTWFFETFLLAPHLAGYREFHPQFGYLFNSYYEAVGSRHPRAERGLLSRPGIDEIAAYRRHADEAMLELIGGGPERSRPDVCALIELGLHHEQQHQELALMDIKHVLSLNPMHPTYRPVPAPAATESIPLSWTEHDGGLMDIGHEGRGFAFDNEGPRHREYLQPFGLADRPVTCGDWLAFIDDGGYQRSDIWLSEGWATVQAQKWQAPLYWHHSHDDSDQWQVFTLHGLRDVDPAEPVCHVSYFEADAYAHWAGARLPTEAEWEVVATAAASGSPTGGSPTASRSLDLDALHPRSARWGEVWEWTASAYLPYPGFRPAAGAVGEYNGKFMVNQQVLRGGSCITPPGHRRPTYRNFFPPSARWPFTGVRLARSI